MEDLALDGIAIALASKVPSLANHENSAVTVGLGNYAGATALSVGGTIRIQDTNMQLYGTVGTGFKSKKLGSSVGIRLAW